MRSSARARAARRARCASRPPVARSRRPVTATSRPVRAITRPGPAPMASATRPAVSDSSPAARGSRCSSCRRPTASGISRRQASRQSSSRLRRQAVGASCVVTGHQAADVDGVVARHLTIVDESGEDLRQASPEQQGPEVVELGQAVGVGGEQELAERHELEGLPHESGRQRTAVVGGEPDVHEDVVEGLGEVGGVAVERVVVQQHDRDPPLLGGTQERSEAQRVAVREVDVVVAVRDVELQRHPELDGSPRQPRVDDGMGEAERPVCLGAYVGQRGRQLVGGGPPSGES